MIRNKVVLVDTSDKAYAEMDKNEAHIRGELHRAFSVFLFNSNGEMLIHQRAADKYHGAGLWTNACCSHPQWGEDIKQSALSRLTYEMGIECDIQEVFSFIYHAHVENGLIEHEFDHVFIGFTDDLPNFNPSEVADYQWIRILDLQHDIQHHPYKYTYWFQRALPDVIDILPKVSRPVIKQ